MLYCPEHFVYVYIFNIYNNFTTCLIWLVEPRDMEPVDMEGPLYYAILYKGLEHLWILVSVEVLEPVPWGYWEKTVLSSFYKHEYVDTEKTGELPGLQLPR